MYVLIIGGGIGGLCLAQGLLKAGIRAAVFERQKHPTETWRAMTSISIATAGKPRKVHTSVSWSWFEGRERPRGSEFFIRDEKLQLLARRDEAPLGPSCGRGRTAWDYGAGDRPSRGGT
jgi:2-polyprenyl-6-methoxyphenol hydroxylase-like FAD-dependent oxidoreductase